MFMLMQTMVKRTLPKNTKRLDKAYDACQKRKKFRVVEKSTFHDYVVRGQKDLASAENDFKNEDYYWVRIKAYQALFHILNALLVKHLGYFSKDHGCILFSLMKHGIITDDAAEKLHIVVDPSKNEETVKPEDTIQDIDDFRIQRNFALYKPKAWDEVTKEDIKQELDKINDNIKILVELL